MIALRALLNKHMLAASSARAISTRWFSAFSNHRNTEDNNDDTPFEFTKENYEKIQELLNKYPTNYKESACIPALFIAQKQNDNFLTLSAMNKVAKVLDMQPMQVYEVASFYTMFNRTRVGKYHLQVCGTTPCQLRGSRDIIKAIQDHAGIEMDGTSEDGLFTVSEVECLGACVNAPMIQVNNEYVYEVSLASLMITLPAGSDAGVHGQPHGAVEAWGDPQDRTLDRASALMRTGGSHIPILGQVQPGQLHSHPRLRRCQEGVGRRTRQGCRCCCRR